MKCIFKDSDMQAIPLSTRARPPSAGMPLFALGFRPFYLLAALFAALSVSAWVARLHGWIEPARMDLAWHMHEMVYGFAIAVVIGFLYTAGRNWTGLWTPRGPLLALLAGLWVLGRLAMLWTPAWLAAVVDLAFLPAAAWPLYRVLKRSGNSRNLFLVGLLAGLAALNGLFHAAAAGALPFDPSRPLHAALMLIIVIEIAIGGRVIPMFTRNALPGVSPVTSIRRDQLALALTVAAGLAWAFGLHAAVAVPLSAAAALAQGARLAGWRPQATLANPLLWILHLSYAWIPLGMALLALAQLGMVPLSAAVHALGVGAIGGLIAGMVTRTARGHTGLPLQADAADRLIFVLIQGAVVLRVAAALTGNGALREAALGSAAVCWSGAFLTYLASYGPRLIKPRVDGKEG
jgi:uncharacterized protein involved in response to NO